MIHFHEVTYTYPGSRSPALQQVSAHIRPGELALVVGASGSGKSTLLRCTNGLVPHYTGGKIQGTIRVAGQDPVQAGPGHMSRQVGFVFQDPEAQFVVDIVEDEIAFALENAAVPVDEMHKRVAEALEYLGLSAMRERRVETLSGGERQRVAIASALAWQPHVLVLDEPTSQLDPQSAEEVLQALVRLNHELGMTVLLAEHRLERVLPFADRMVYLEAGRSGALCGPPRQVLAEIELASPLVSLGKALGWQPLPLTAEQARPFALAWQKEKLASENDTPKVVSSPQREPYIRAEGLEVSYGERPALRGADLTLYPGEVLVLMGPNGAGKTTLLRCLVGLIRAEGGWVWVGGEEITGQPVVEISRRVGYLPQDPNALLFADTVIDELLITLRNHNIPLPPEGETQATLGGGVHPARLLERLGLGDKAAAYPRDLSTGERQRVALGAITVTRPGALLLDEPTRGLDYAAKRVLVELLQGWRGQGMAIMLVTHDVELAAQVADRVALIDEGQIKVVGRAVDVLSSSAAFMPQMAQLFPGRGWLTVMDVLHSI